MLRPAGRLALYTALAVAAAADPPINVANSCLTPQGTLCRTIRWEYTGWENQSWGFHAVKRWTGSQTLSYRRDGSTSERDIQQTFRNYVIPSGGWDIANIRLLGQGETIEIDNAARKYEVRSGVLGGLTVGNPSDQVCEQYASAFGLSDLKRIGGVVIAGVRSIEYAGARSTTRLVTVVLAPSLGCTQMRKIDRSYNRLGMPTAYSRSEVVSVQIGEPDPVLFQVPKGYRQKKP